MGLFIGLALSSLIVRQAHADLLFVGKWENYLKLYYGPNGWMNGFQQGHATKTKGWTDTLAFGVPIQVDNTWAGNMSQAPARIQLVSDPSSPLHSMVARFEVNADDYAGVVHSGERSEMIGMIGKNRKALNVSTADGHEFYGISVKLREDWKSPQHEGNVLWGTFMQLHSPNAFNSPPAFDLMAEGDFHLDWNAGDLDQVLVNPVTKQQRHVKKDSAPFAFTDGSLHVGHWVQFMLDVVWATTPKGSLVIYRRDEGMAGFRKILNLQNIATLQTYSTFRTDLASCPTCAPGNLVHYWRVGYYRSNSPGQTNVLWLGPVVRGTSFDEVATAAFGTTGPR